MTDTRYLAARPNLPVSDVARSVEFYRRVLGFDVRVDAPEFGLAVVGKEDAEIALLRTDSPPPGGCYLTVEGVDTLHARCVEAGATIAVALQTQPWGMRDFVLEDPDGHRIALGEQVSRAA
ncbi:MAG: hypothetical protein GEU80_03935 [Dehalococcoidia bacterium]|nr:hypothetical protein [Dehalococcoidia bacterium]